MTTSILVVYATTQGQTAKVARFVTDELRLAGAEVDCLEAGTADPRPEEYDAVIVAASVHASAFQRPVEQWVRRHAAALRQRPTLFLAVCLAVLQQDPKAHAELRQIVARFTQKTGWTPAEVQFIPGALRYSAYGWLTRIIMKRIAARAGGAIDTSRDHEYTDWAELRVMTLGFLAALREGAPTAL